MIRLFALALVLAATGASAREDVVVLSTTGGPEERAALEASVGELLRRLKLPMVDRADDALATVRIELGDPESAVIVKDRAGQLVEYRRVPRSSSQQVTLEALALVVQSAVEAVAELERNPPQPTRRGRALSDPPIVTVPIDAPRSPVGVELGAFVSGRGFGVGAPFVFGGGVLVGLRLERAGTWSPRFSLLAAYNGPFGASSADVQISTQSASARLLGGARLSAGRFAFDGQLGLGVDALFTDARSTSLGAGDLRDRFDASPTVTALLSVRSLLTPTTEVFVSATADLDLVPRRFVTDLSGVRTVLFETWRVRPAVLLGFSFDVVGTRRSP